MWWLLGSLSVVVFIFLFEEVLKGVGTSIRFRWAKPGGGVVAVKSQTVYGGRLRRRA